MGGLIFILFVAVAVIMIGVGISQSKQATEAWSGTANSLGLTLSPGGAFQRRSLSGTVRGNHVFVDTFSRKSGKNSTTYTRYRITYPRPLGLGLKLTQEGFFTGFTKALGAQDIEIGDAVFDQEVLIKGNDPRAVARFLTLARRSRIHHAMQSFSRLKILDNQIHWEHRGVQRSELRLSDTIRRLSLLAWFLCGDRDEDQALETAARARQDGNLDEAMKAVRQVPAVDDVPPIEARMMEAHMLHLGNRGEEAGRVMNEVIRHAPDNEEVKQWATMQNDTPPPPPLPGAPGSGSAEATPPPAVPAVPVDGPAAAPATPEPPPTPPPTAAATPPAPAPPPPSDPGLTAENVCTELFGEGGSSARVEKLFAASHAGRRVTWQGTLRDQRSTSFDFVFGNQPCTKATIELLELEGGSFGRKTVQAIVQFPPDAEPALKDMTGRQVTFSGELQKVDGLMRNVFVKDAVLD